MTDLKIAFGGLCFGFGAIVSGRALQITLDRDGNAWHLLASAALLIGTGWWIFSQLWKEKP